MNKNTLAGHGVINIVSQTERLMMPWPYGGDHLI